jgi:hypothetical protein
VRGVGTVITRGNITGGRLAQAASWTTIINASSQRRLPWSHYLSNRGVVECIGAVDHAVVADAHLTAEPTPGQLNLTAISMAALNRIVADPDHGDRRKVDRRPPLRSNPTTLRFAIAATSVTALSTDEHGKVRRLKLSHTGAQPKSMVELCEDLARHDWLLTTVLEELARVDPFPPGHPQTVQRLAAVLDALAHLWAPAVRLEPSLRELWHELDSHLGMSGQWLAMMTRIRDRLLVAAVGGHPTGQQG